MLGTFLVTRKVSSLDRRASDKGTFHGPLDRLAAHESSLYARRRCGNMIRSKEMAHIIMF